MTTFTLSLHQVIETLYGSTMDPDDYVQTYENVTVNNITYGELPILADNGILLGIGGYPIFNEDYRKVLNGKIIDRYWNREIGSETIDTFRLSIRRKLNEIMPFYNELYKSTLVEYSPLQTMDIHSVGSSSIIGEESGLATNISQTNNDSSSRAVTSDTPQTQLAALEDYASGASDVNSQSEIDANSTSNTSGNTSTESDTDTRVTGFQGVASDLMVKFRESIINIDMMILDEIQTCFMLVLNNGDAYTGDSYYYGRW